jgi:hypothetical protein
MARANVNQVTQIGVETTAGTAVACNRRFPGLQIDIGPELDAKFYSPEGNKYDEVGVLNREWASGDLNGPLTYGEIVYLFGSYINYAAPSTTSGVTTWTFSDTPTGAATYKTFTVQRGDSTAAGQSTNVVVTSLNLNIDRMDARVTGNVIGKKIDYAASLTATPTTIENKPISMNDVSVYLDSTSGVAGTTKLTDVFEVTVNHPDKVDETWVLDSAQTSWKDLVEKKMQPTVTVRCEWNTQMQAVYTAMKADTLPTRWLQLKMPGEIISGSDTYNFTATYACKLLTAKEDKKGDGGVYGFTFTFRAVNDATWAKPYLYTVVNATASL